MCPKQEMFNQTTLTEFLLLGFSDIRELQVLHFVGFLIIYLAALVGNLLIIIVVALSRQLHTPMYFFLGNLSFLDICYISVTVPKSMANSLINNQLISFSGCVAQVFLILTLAFAEMILLVVMAYDRYVAICHPLHYRVIMNNTKCAHMVFGCWTSAVLYSVMHTGNTFRLSFCRSKVIGQFFCDIPQLLKISCCDTSANEIFVIVCVVFFGFILIGLIFMSYIHIFSTIQRIPSAQGKYKTISTCLPHLFVFSLFMSTTMFTYMRPKSMSSLPLDLLASVFYSVVSPLLNPLVYSLRNKELKDALGKMLFRIVLMKNVSQR